MARRILPGTDKNSDQVYSVGAPLGGLNTRDSLQRMSPNDCVQIENWYGATSELRVRGGSLYWASGITGPSTVQSIHVYAGNGSSQLFADTGANIHDITAGGAVGAAVYTWPALGVDPVSINFTNSAGTQYLWIANANSAPVTYDGAVWAAATITGMTPANITYAWIHSFRIFFVERNTMNVWYLAVNAIQGAATKLPLGAIFPRGGTIRAGVSWSVDGGSGPDDYWAVITSEGEVAVYRGTNPASMSSWGLVGVFYIGRPLGNIPFAKYGGDVLLLTENGLSKLTAALPNAMSNSAIELSSKIKPTFTEAVRNSVNYSNWSITVVPNQDAIVIVVPGLYDVGEVGWLVYNVVTKAWFPFTGAMTNVNCLTLWNGKLYGGAKLEAGNVYNVWNDTLTSDSYFGLPIPIVANMQTAFSYFSFIRGLRQIDLMRFGLRSTGPFELQWGLAVDYGNGSADNLLPTGTLGGDIGVWDVSDWDEAFWDADPVRLRSWFAARNEPGYATSLFLRVSSSSGTITWAATDYTAKYGGLM